MKKIAAAMNRDIVVIVFLAVTVFLAFGRIVANQFINFDDPSYVTENINVTAGLAGDSILWAFTSTWSSNWHPLTWLSHMLDVEMFGLWPGGHHLTSLILHALCAILLFLALKWMTGARWRSAFVAALFALHPLRVESVAWAAERKDVLSAVFWMLTILAYLWHLRRRGAGRYALLMIAFALGLLSKPMVVTLPFVLLLLDYWPLRRFPALVSPNDEPVWPSGTVRSLVVEKMPLFLLSGLSSAMTFYAQRHGGAVSPLEWLGPVARLFNAILSYVAYLGKTFWPVDLIVYYPYRKVITIMPVVGALAVLAAITIAALLWRRRRPWLLVGWFWYLGTLAPVIGLVQVGSQSMADRYTYLPLIGIYVIASWAFGALAAARPAFKPPATLIGIIAVVAFAAVTAHQTGYWKNSETLFRHAYSIAPSVNASLCLGSALDAQGRGEEAVPYFKRAIALNPHYPIGYYNLGRIYERQKKYDDVEALYRKAFEIEKDKAQGLYMMGMLSVRRDRHEEAVRYFTKALDERPDYIEARVNLANEQALMGKRDEAERNYREVLSRVPNHPAANYNYGYFMSLQGKTEEAVDRYGRALAADPNYHDALLNLSNIFIKTGRNAEALQLLERMVRLDPKSALTLYNIACMHGRLGDTAQALLRLREALQAGYNKWDLISKDSDLEKVRETKAFKELIDSMKGKGGSGS